MWKYPDADPAKRDEIRRYVVVEMQLNRSTLVAKTPAEIRKNLEARSNAAPEFAWHPQDSPGRLHGAGIHGSQSTPDAGTAFQA